jgi:dihydrofolate reductase
VGIDRRSLFGNLNDGAIALLLVDRRSQFGDLDDGAIAHQANHVLKYHYNGYQAIAGLLKTIRLSAMGQLVLYIATSLDGYIARNGGAVDWLFTDQDYGYEDFYNSCDRLIMGRNTYEQIQGWGDYPYPDKHGFVFSRNIQQDRDENVTFVSGDLADFVSNLKSEDGKNIWLVGGAAIAKVCLENNLIDKFILSIHPLVLGDGIALFPAPLPTLNLKLENSQVFNTGLLQLTYSALR